MALGAILKVKMDSSAVKRGLMNLKSGFARLGAVAKGAGRMAMKFWKPIGITLAAVSGAVMKSADFMARINNEMKRTGRGVHDILATGKALEFVGLNAEESADLINDMQERLEDARYGGGTAQEGIDKLKEAGLVLQDLLRMGPQDQFETIMGAAHKAGLSVGETAFALDKIFGGKGQELTGLAFEFEKTMGKARDITKDLAADLVKQGPKRIEEVQFAFLKMKTSLAQVGVALAQAFPWEMLVEGAKSLAKIIPGLLKVINAAIENPRGFLIRSFEVFLGFWQKFIQGVDAWINGLIDRLMAKAEEIGNKIGEAITSGIGGIKNLLFPGKGRDFDAKEAMDWMMKKGRPVPKGSRILGSVEEPGIGKRMLGAILDGNRLLGNIENKPGASFVG